MLSMLTIAPILLALNVIFGYAPMDVQATITVEPAAINRGVCIAWESENNSGSSCWEVDGLNAPKTQRYRLRALPSGNYVVRAELITTEGRKVTPLKTLKAIASIQEDQESTR